MRYGQIKQNNWFKTFFDKYYLLLYSKKGIFSPAIASKEVNFVIKVLGLPKNSSILDLPCGQGRHSVKLAKKGYKVTGVDLSKTLLDLAGKLAKKEKVNPRFIRKDMRKISFKGEFDAVINLFSSYGYFSKEKENLKILEIISKALKPKGKFLIDLLNRDWLLGKLSAARKIWWKAGDSHVLEDLSFGTKKRVWINHITIILPSGKERHAYTFMRLYSLSEIKRYLKKGSFKILKVYGDYRGNKFTASSPRMIVLAQKNDN